MDSDFRKLTVIIPAYNEAPTIQAVLARVNAVTLMNGLVKEIIIVNDCSTDATSGEIDKFISAHTEIAIVNLRHGKNAGKGAALHTGILNATGDLIVIQDADMEYDPEEYNILLKPILDGHADVVYGSRFVGSNAHRILFFWHSIGNKFLTFLSNMLTNLNLTDMETGSKMFRADILKSIRLKEKRFGFEPEITAKLARIPGIRIYEVGVSYYGRTFEEGKKISWKDGIRAIYCILKYRF